MKLAKTLAASLASGGLVLMLSVATGLAQNPPAQSTTPAKPSAGKAKDATAPKLPKSIKLEPDPAKCAVDKDRSLCIPDVIAKAVKTEYPKGTISKAEKVAKNLDFSDYEFDVNVKNNNKTYTLIIAKDGKISKTTVK